MSLRVLRVPLGARREAIFRIAATRPREQGLIFVPTRAEADRWARAFSGQGYRCVAYHAGMSAEERRAIEGALRAREVDLVAATSAFGLGMDFPHLCWVALAHPPVTLLSLAQGVGRVGRGGKPADAYVLWDVDDFSLLDGSIAPSERQREEVRHTLRFLSAPGCKIRALESYFDACKGPGGGSTIASPIALTEEVEAAD